MKKPGILEPENDKNVILYVETTCQSILMYILVLNCGSSSIKYAVIEPETETSVLQGLIEIQGSDYQQGLQNVVDTLQQQPDILNSLSGTGHRVVHGGELFKTSIVIDDNVLNQIKACIPLAPLHNPENVLGIEFMKMHFPNLPNVAVFDTAFHQTMPEHAFLYALPYKLYKEHHIRRYGFHGTSHAYVTQQAARLLEKPYKECALLSAHLGNGCSACAVLNGKSIDTSMGLTPLEGLVMGTRSGDIDPGIVIFLQEQLGYDAKTVDQLLNKKSGLLGISDVDSDMRALTKAMNEGNERVKLAIDIFCYRLAKTLGALMVPLGRLDALIFTGGIGENSAMIREKTLQLLSHFHFEFDAKKNAAHGPIITTDKSLIAMVIKTNEELMIANDTATLI